MEKYYSFAGVDIAVSVPDDRMYPEDRALTPFRVASVSDPHRFSYEITQALTPPVGPCIADVSGFRVYREGEGQVRYIGSVAEGWERAYIRASHQGREHRVQVLADQIPGRIGVKTVLNSIAGEHLVAEQGGVVFHCSYIDWHGTAILFTAPSGTGKSTQAELWKQLRGAQIINGDRAVIRWMDGKAYACGIPFSGSSPYCENRTLPLKAIVYLAQAPETSVSRLRGVRAFGRIWEGCSINTWDPVDMDRISRTVQQIATHVPVFYLPCTPDESAVAALERALKECEI